MKTSNYDFANVFKLAKKLKLTFVALFFLAAHTASNAHGVQTAWCFAPNGDDIRIYIEHWHGPGQNVDCGAGATINISVAINGGAATIHNNLSFYSNIHGTLGTLPREPNFPLEVISTCTGANTYDHWGSWDFPIPEGLCPEGGTINITVLGANDCVFEEACSQLYPASTNTIITSAECPCGPGLPGVDADGDDWIDICDCDDNDPNVNPGMTEICGNGIDDDCDGTIDIIDTDGDGSDFCNGDDCDDDDPTVYSGAPELCDGKDNNCDGVGDVDNDGDGVMACEGDCDDNDPDIYPGATEVCNGIDDNCDGVIDEGFVDFDGDGHSGIGACSGSQDDCDDDDPNIYPGAPELCDGKDNDCNGEIETSIGYNVDLASTNMPNSCGAGNMYNDCSSDLEFQWTSTNDDMLSGTLEFSIGVNCNSMMHRSVFLNGVAQCCVMPTQACSCSNTAQPFVVVLNPANYISNGVNIIRVEAYGDCFGLRELTQFGANIYANACIEYCEDPDDDDVCGDDDNCPDMANADQADADGDGLGDVCDDCPLDADNDIDGDGVCGDVDNCVDIANADQVDADGDGMGDVCDECPYDEDNDIDGDGVCGDVDNCVNIANADQVDSDNDGMGNACDECPYDEDNDIDGDGVCGDVDNCPDTANADQADEDCDTVGDVCDICPGGDDTVDNNGDGIPDCSQALSLNEYADDWKCGNKNKKVKLCHVPPGNPDNPQELCVSVNSIPSHLSNHDGDAVGPCTKCDEEELRSKTNENEQNLNGLTVQPNSTKSLTDFTVYPNPTTTEVNLFFKSKEATLVDLLVTDILGNTVIIKKQDLIRGANEIKFDVNQFTDGIYLISMKVGNGAYIVRFAKVSN